jgi:beta-N-acetylhexosaminidase
VISVLIRMRDNWRWWTAAAAVVLVGAVLGVSRGGDRPTASESPSSAASSPSSPVFVPSPTPSAVAASTDCVGSALASLSVAERAGQVLMVGTSVDAPSGLGDTISRYRLGGVFLHGRSTRPAADLRADIGALQRRTRLPMLVSLDQEGGSVQTLKGPSFPIIPSALKLGAGPAATLEAVNSDSAQRLRAIGVTMNLAPVADTVPASIGEDNPPIGAFHRQYGSDPARVAASIRTVVRADQGKGVLTTLKHFPGLGRVRANTDTSDKAVDATATVNDPYLQPFAAGIDAGSAGVMISSASYPRLDPSAIAAFSGPIVTRLLRDRLGFRGLVLSDDLGAAGAVRGVPVGQRAVRFVAAGGDLVLTIRPSDAAPMVAALIDRAGRDAAFRSRLADAAGHVLQAKQRAGLLRC